MSDARGHLQVINLNEVESRNVGVGSKFGVSMKKLAAPTGTGGIGCSWYEVGQSRVFASFPLCQ